MLSGKIICICITSSIVNVEGISIGMNDQVSVLIYILGISIGIPNGLDL